MPKLRNQRHERFAQGITEGKSAKQAYIDAGYKARGNAAEVSASQLLRKTKVKARVEELNSKLERSAIATRQEALETLTRILRQELTEDVVAQKLGELLRARPSMSSVIQAIKTMGDFEGWGQPSAGNPGQVGAIAEALEFGVGEEP